MCELQVRGESPFVSRYLALKLSPKKASQVDNCTAISQCQGDYVSEENGVLPSL